MIKRFLFGTWLLCAVLIRSSLPLHAATPTTQASGVYVMGDLLVTDWGKFRSQLKTLKSLGVQGVTIDVWWGLVAQDPVNFDWNYYREVFKAVRDADLKLVPILSSHACGGNVGDHVNIPLPEWLFKKYPDIATVSEAGNINTEYPSVWSTERVLPELTRFWASFMENFKDYQDIITEIPLSFGPSGEVQFPSHHSHDASKGVSEAYFPNRGVIQAFSGVAIDSFRKWVAEVQYPGKSAQELRDLWGFESLSGDQISPLLLFSQMNIGGKLIPAITFDWSVARVNDFFGRRAQFSRFGQDFFKWYQWSLLNHARLMLTRATEIFQGTQSAFQSIPLAIKIPGAHWRVGSDRLAELTAGLINTDTPADFPVASIPDGQPVSGDFGYRAIFDVIQQVRSTHPNLKLVATYTAIEMPDSPSWEPNSRGHTLPKIIFALGNSLGIDMSGENAIGSNLYDGGSIDRMFQFLWNGQVSHIVLLRIDEVIDAVQQNGPLKSAICRDYLSPKKAGAR